MVESSENCFFLKKNGRARFVRNPIYIQGITRVLNSFGLITPQISNGIINIRCDGAVLPAAVVDSEKIFQEVCAHRKYKVAGMTPEEWFGRRLILIDGERDPNALVADTILQALFFINRYNRNDKVVNLEGIPEKAALATAEFLRKDLFEQYRGRWLDWLWQAI